MSAEPKILDSTAIKLYKLCPRKYRWRMIEGYQPSQTQPYFAFGSAYHLFRELLEQEYKQLKTFTDDDLKACFPKPAAAAIQYWTKHGTESIPGTKWDFLNSDRLIKSLHYVMINWIKEKREGKYIVLATEQAFTLEMPDGSFTGGRADQIIKWNGKVWGRDFKTSSKLGDFYQRTLEPNDQFTRYTWAESKLAGEKVQGQLVEVLYNTKKEGPKLVPFTTSRTDYQINTWLKENKWWVEAIKRSREENMYPMSENHCPFCEYRSVCTMPGEQSMMQHLKSTFTHSPWNFENPNNISDSDD